MLLTTIIFSQSLNKGSVYSELEIDSIISANVKSTTWLFAAGATLIHINPNPKTTAAKIGYSLLAYTLAIGPNTAYFKLGFAKEGVFRSARKSLFTAVPIIGTFTLIKKLSNAKLGSIDDAVLTAVIVLTVGTLSTLYINHLMIKRDMKNLKKMYLEDRSTLSFLPSINLQQKSLSMNLQLNF